MSRRYGGIRRFTPGWVLCLVMLVLAACATARNPAAAPGPDEHPAAETPPAPAEQADSPEASGFPDKPIKIIVTHSAGGATDTPVRVLAPYAEEMFGQPVILENMTGAGGNIAREFVWKAAPDGYTLLASQSPSMDSGQIVTGADFDPMGFAHVFNIAGKNFNATAVRTDAPYRTLDDLIEAARANPGKINIAGPGLGTNSHVSVKLLEKAAGIQLNYVPFDSGPEAEAAVLGGQTDAASGNLGNFVGRPELRILATDGPERDSRAPDIPTFKELGVPAALDQLVGIFAPPKTPDSIVEALAKGFSEAAANPQVEEKLKNAESQPFFLKTEAFFKAHKEIYDSIQSIADLLQSD